MYPLPITLLEALSGYFAHSEQFMFFDTARPGVDNRFSYLFTHPLARLQCRITDPVGPFLAEVEQWLSQGYYLAGWFGYEFSALLDPATAGLIRRPPATTVLADLGVFGRPHVFDHQSGEHDFPCGGAVGQGPAEYAIEQLRLNTSEEEYLAALRKVLGYIAAGDTYQVNYTLKLLFSLQGSVESFYRALRRNQSVPYGAYLRWGRQRILSFSPELFFRKNKQSIAVRPMKGTLRRGLDINEDLLAAAFLHSDEKNRAENVMIVDLLRNDLGRVLYEAGGGEVRVKSLFDVETYESLLQMTSSIEGTGAAVDLDTIPLLALWRAIFPCGSVTGAPKIRTMQIIAEQEKESRGVYTGAIGFLSPQGDAVFNVPIRTVVLEGDRGEMGIGSGITHDSNPQDEWQECLLKGRFLTHPIPEFKLIETLLWGRDGGYWLLAAHLERLRKSAEYFYFSFDVEELSRRLTEASQGWTEPSQRLRVLLAKDGEISFQGQPCPWPRLRQLPILPEPLTGDEPILGIATEATRSGDVWLRHKTTNRACYDRQFAQATELGWADALFQNEKGEVTEGCISNLVIRHRGRYLTPPLTAGILPGVLRANLLAGDGPLVEEKSLTLTEVGEAEAVFLANSVRGLVRVRMADFPSVSPE